jgi:hypothetical protein
MPSSADHARALRDRCDTLKAQLAHVGDLRPGSLVERYRRCGKPTCHCAGPGAEGHGPSWSLTREVAGKTVTTVIPAGAVEQTRQQIAEHKRFRALANALVEASAHVCDAQLRTPEAASPEAAQKGGSRRRSKPRSSPRSTRS